MSVKGSHMSHRTECWWPGDALDPQPKEDEAGGSHLKHIMSVSDSSKCQR